MFKAFFVWLLFVGLLLGSLGYGFWCDAGAEALRQKSLLAALHDEKSGQAGIAAAKVLQSLESLSELIVKFRVGEMKTVITPTAPQFLKESTALTLVEAQNKLMPFQETDLAQRKYATYFVDILQKPYAVLVRALSAEEKIEGEDYAYLAYFLPRNELDLVKSDANFLVYIYDLHGVELRSSAMPVEIQNLSFESGNLELGGELGRQAAVEDIGLRIKTVSVYPGTQILLLAKLKTKWQYAILGVAFSLVCLLFFIIWQSLTVSEVQHKYSALELHVAAHAERVAQQRAMAERQEAHRELAEGIFGVISSPLNNMRTDLNMMYAASSQAEAEGRLKAVNNNIDRIDSFITALKTSSNPGRVAVIKSDVQKTLLELIAPWREIVEKRAARIVDERVLPVGEVQLPDRDIRIILKNILEFEKNRAIKDLKPKNIVLNLEKIPNGACFVLIDNMSVEDKEFASLEENIYLAIAKATLEKNYCTLTLAKVGSGEGLEIRCEFSLPMNESLTKLTKDLA